MGSYKIRFTKSAEKDLRRIEKTRIFSVLEKIEALSVNPRLEGIKKLVGSDAAYRLRVGEYRVIYTIDDGIKIVQIDRVRHRKEAYR
jgi:mRNA interferase RelE/StbE